MFFNMWKTERNRHVNVIRKTKVLSNIPRVSLDDFQKAWDIREDINALIVHMFVLGEKERERGAGERKREICFDSQSK